MVNQHERSSTAAGEPARGFPGPDTASAAEARTWVPTAGADDQVCGDRHRQGILRRYLQRAEVEPAVVWGGLAAAWQFGSAPVTMLLIASGLSVVEQGFYYTFVSLIALQTYVELGLSVVVLNTASHEWARLRLTEEGTIAGDPRALSRLVSLARFALTWYGVASCLFAGTVGMGGHLFLAQQASLQVSWREPWWALVILTSLLLWALPFNALLEGCNQVTTIQKFRFSQAVLRTLSLWIALGVRGGLWAAVAAAAVGVLRDVYLLAFQYARFFKTLFGHRGGPSIDWKTEIWPMQWRLAVGGMVSYFLFQTFTPVMFHYHSAVVAGQMGMTMAVVFAVQGLASVWLQARVPRFGMLIADQNWGALDRLWWRTTGAAVAITVLASTGVWGLVYVLNALEVGLAQRLLPPGPTALLLLGAVFMATGYCQTAYLRAHRQEPIFMLSVVTSLLMGGLVWLLGSSFGPIGAAAAYLIVVAGISMPWETVIWLRCRAKWHGTPAEGRPGPSFRDLAPTGVLKSDSK